jgi:hypothetical protein
MERRFALSPRYTLGCRVYQAPVSRTTHSKLVYNDGAARCSKHRATPNHRPRMELDHGYHQSMLSAWVRTTAQNARLLHSPLPDMAPEWRSAQSESAVLPWRLSARKDGHVYDHHR